jgi:hypothetical protein
VKGDDANDGGLRVKDDGNEGRGCMFDDECKRDAGIDGSGCDNCDANVCVRSGIPAAIEVGAHRIRFWAGVKVVTVD